MKYIVFLLSLTLFACNGTNRTPSDDDKIISENNHEQHSENEQPELDNSTQDKDSIELEDDIVEVEAAAHDADTPIVIDDGRFDGDPYAVIKERVPFKYYGDYDVTSKDPEGVKKLWEYFYASESTPRIDCVPNSYDKCAEAYPFEPIIREPGDEVPRLGKAIQPITWDSALTPYHWSVDHLASYPFFHEYEGKVWISMNALGDRQSSGTYEYDLETHQIIKYGKYSFSGYSNDNYIFMDTKDLTKNWIHSDKPGYDPKTYASYYDKKNNTYGWLWKMERPIGAAGSVRASDEYIHIKGFYVDEYEAGVEDRARTFYTKIGEWDKWKELNAFADLSYGFVYPTVKEHYFTAYTKSLEVIWCDLEKGDAGCVKVSLDGEKARYPQFSTTHKIYYSRDERADGNGSSLVEADLTDPQNIKRRVITTDQKIIGVMDGDEQFVLYDKINGGDSHGSFRNVCYFRLKDEKHFCLEDGINNEIYYNYSYFYKHWLVYQHWYDVVVRDMEPYCDAHPENCPFDDYTPKVKK